MIATRGLVRPALPAALHRSFAAPIAALIVVAIVVVALAGPALAPHSPTELVGAPFMPPGPGGTLGTDFLGRDVLSRLLNGGRSVVLLAGIATVLAYLVGASIGLLAGYSRTWVDPFLMRIVDVLLAFPPILLLLMLATAAGANLPVLVAGIALVHIPGIARIVRTATLEVSVRGYVEAAVARGEPTSRILRREICPNIVPTIVADGGPRLTVSILLVAALNFLGLGLRPPTADWAVMIAENRGGLSLNAWSVVAPALVIAALTISVNIVADAVASARGLSSEAEVMRR